MLFMIKDLSKQVESFVRMLIHIQTILGTSTGAEGQIKEITNSANESIYYCMLKVNYLLMLNLQIESMIAIQKGSLKPGQYLLERPLKTILESALEYFQTDITQKGLNIEINVIKQAEKMIRLVSDWNLYIKIFCCLFMNAIKRSQFGQTI